MRYVRLTELIPELLDMVDEKKIAFNPAYELSFLKPDEQQMLVETMDYEQAIKSFTQTRHGTTKYIPRKDWDAVQKVTIRP